MVLIIAEAGVNHNGDISMAKKLIDIAKDAGADYVKFQTFNSSKLASSIAQKATYQISENDSTQGNQLEMLQKLELNKDQHIELIQYCNKKGIRFLSTAFDMESIDLLVELGIEIFKIPSGEITNLPYLKKIGRLKKDIILSTGMSTIDEISDAINILVNSGTKLKNITVLHCTSDYPTKMEDVNLRAMLNIQKQFDVKIGYSDHTLGIEVSIAAVALGARIIEKHFTLDRMLPGPDHKASLEPDELRSMISSIRNIESAMGSELKQPTETELQNRTIARKSIHLSKKLPAGHIISEKDISMKRPGNGISPMQIEDVIGKKTLTELTSDHLLKWEDLE